jgi:NADH:ubiquinone oxidoreductase subunit 6 (subunit J)
MVYLIFNAITASFSLAIIRDRDTFFSCPAKIETFSIVSSVFILTSARAIDRFFAVLSASAKFLVWRNIYYSNS